MPFLNFESLKMTEAYAFLENGEGSSFKSMYKTILTNQIALIISIFENKI